VNEISVMARFSAKVMNFFAELCNAASMKSATAIESSFQRFVSLSLGKC
jgi:hypothetical protein